VPAYDTGSPDLARIVNVIQLNDTTGVSVSCLPLLVE
jgi:hypothetical protein